MSQILIVVHQATSNPGLVGEKLRSRGYQLDVRCPALGDPLPSSMAQHAAAIIFGGPMSANEDAIHPFIRAELDWLPTVLSSRKPYLGICLGAQLLARVLGAEVGLHPQAICEIGYFSLRPTPTGRPYIPHPMQVYHWHKEGFTLPQDAVKLAEGDTFANQAFCYKGTAFGLQFHPEITHTMINDWTSRTPEHLVLPGAQSRELHLQNHTRFGATVDSWLDTFLDTWLKATPWGQQQSA
ncbi:MAG: glutamine amidotransferase [Cyanobacteria bacterium J06626_18]